MSSRKRSAPSPDLEDEIKEEQNLSQKRPRLNGTEDTGDDADSVDEPNGKKQSKQTGVEEEEEDDEEEEDELNEEGDDEEMEEMMEEMRTQQQGDARDHPAEAGVIDRVDLKNFMCHQHLTMKLGQQLNFVIGHNGSGKSAILTGITIALGGKASNTNRGSSLKSFVREGADHAEVILTMRNEGLEAFKPQLYGKRIIIERKIGKVGGSTWKLKNFAGKVVSTKREEIDAYCDHTNIQVDNPMNVLSQDAARQFLSTSHAKDKYSFFLKGTQLNQLAHEYDTLENAIAGMKTQVSKHEESIPDLSKDVRECMTRYKALDKARSQKEELQKLQEKMVWSQVIAKEKEVEKQTAETEKAKAKLDLVKQHISENEATLEELDAEIQAIEEQAQASREREQPLRDARTAVNQEVKAQMARIGALKVDRERLNDQFNQYEDDIKRLQKSIDDEAARLAQDKREIVERLQAEREECEQKREEHQAEEERMRQELNAHEEATIPLRQRHEELRRDLARVEKTIADKETQIAGLRTSRTQKLHAYGPQTTNILRAIDQYPHWRKKPLGPLGAYVKVKDKRWTPVLESYLNNVLGSYLVTCFEDREALSKIFKQLNAAQSSIIVAKDDNYDFSSGEPDPGILTVRRILEVSDPSVLRALVDNARLEKAALVMARVQGDELVRKSPRNVQFALSGDLFRLSGGARGSSTQTMTPFNGIPRLTADVDEGIRQLQEVLREAEQQKRELDRRISEVKKELTENSSAITSCKNKIPGLNRSVRQLTAKLQEIEDDLREDEPANVAALQENKEEAVREQTKVQEEFRALIQQEEEAKARLKPLSEKSEKYKEQINNFTASRETFVKQLEKKTPDRMTVFNLLSHRRDQLKGKQKDFDDAQRRLSELEAELVSWTEQATDFCPRVDAPESSESYQRKISAIEKAAADARKKGAENIDDVLHELKTKQQALREAQKVIEDIRDLCKMFDKSISNRQTRWKTFRNQIALRARFLFTQNLEHRGYSGSLSFDHENGKLRLRVQTEDTTKARRDKDPKALSGGEKSFATICLLLSLWEAIGCPIRCLDEFDVFMDAVNRKISMKMVADMAKKNPATQFCLITPLNMANINFGPEVRILRMSDPERGQGVLQAGNVG